jgi:hypothetical protein
VNPNQMAHQISQSAWIGDGMDNQSRAWTVQRFAGHFGIRFKLTGHNSQARRTGGPDRKNHREQSLRASRRSPLQTTMRPSDYPHDCEYGIDKNEREIECGE